MKRWRILFEICSRSLQLGGTPSIVEVMEGSFLEFWNFLHTYIHSYINTLIHKYTYTHYISIVYTLSFILYQADAYGTSEK
jgi:hypothetical protein